jgi:hypothetical protein
MIYKIKKLTQSSLFNKYITLLIILAGIIVGLQTWHWLNKSYGHILYILDEIILYSFLIELILNIISEYPKPFRFFLDPWHVFDFLIIALCFLPVFFPNSHTEFFTVLRLARLSRILRVVKIFERIPSLRILFGSLFKALPSMFYVIAILLLQFYIYAVVGTDLFGKYSQDFADLALTFKTLYFVIFNGWADYVKIDSSLFASGIPGWTINLYFISFTLLGATIFLNLFIGIITSEMTEAKSIENLGKHPYHHENHIVILGWSHSIIKIINEYIHAFEEHVRERIVILADRDVKEMEAELKLHYTDDDLKIIKIAFRRGTPFDLTHLNIVNLPKAKSIIVLSDLSSESPDILTIKTLMGIKKLLQDDSVTIKSTDTSTPIIVAEFINNDRILIAKEYFSTSTVHEKIFNKLVFLPVKDFVSKLIAQTCLQPGLSQVYSEILGFAGSEIYIRSYPDFYGKSFDELLMLFEHCTVLGLYSNSDENPVLLNPSGKTVYKNSDKIILLAVNDNSLKPSPDKTYNIDKSIFLTRNKSYEKQNKKNINILIIGNNSKLIQILEELTSYDFGSINITLCGRNITIKLKKIINSLKNDNINDSMMHNNLNSIKTIETDPLNYHEMEIILKNNYRHIILLNNFEKNKNEHQADANSLIVLIHLRKLLGNKIDQGEISIISELINVQNRELATVNKNSDFIISANLTSSMISQLSLQHDLLSIYEELFNTSGCEIYIKPLNEYIIIPNYEMKLNFATLTIAVRNKSEIAIGYIRDGLLKINPNKSELFSITNTDKVIVISEKYT